MSTDDFFKKIDNTIDDLKHAQKQSGEQSKNNLEFIGEVVARVTEKAKKYKNQLKSRSIPVELNVSKYSISFTLKYKDGGHHGIILARAMDQNNQIEIMQSFTNDDGKNYSGPLGRPYDKTSWKDEIFTTAIESCIKDYLFYAPRHGGI